VSPAPNNPLAALEAGVAAALAPGAMLRRGGRITEIAPGGYRASGLSRCARLGDIVEHEAGGVCRAGEIVRIAADDIWVTPFEPATAMSVGDCVFARAGAEPSPSDAWRGRVIDALCRPADGGPPLSPAGTAGGAAAAAPPAMARGRVGRPLRTGVKVVDIFAPLCFGQRLGVFAGSGVGKSTLLAMLANADAFDTVVVALVGERGREVREFLEDTLGDAGRAKTVAVVATGDESPSLRRRAPLAAMRVAEHFRDRGQNVLLLIDSVTRFAHALREVGAAAGEPPVARGYPASVFAELPRLLERAGPGPRPNGDGEAGSITAIVSVLVDGDDMNDPIADCVRGILDGHLVLSRQIAESGRYPAVDPLASLSRLAPKAWSAEERHLVTRLRAMIARFEETRDIRLLGGYQPGADAELDAAVRQVPFVFEALCQRPEDGASPDGFADLARFLRERERLNG
jgi:flagellum-specific ATP synthase